MSDLEKAVAISGYAVVMPKSFLRSTLTPELNQPVAALSRKVARFACRAAPEALTAVERALQMAGFDPESCQGRTGLYTNQGGILTPDLDDFDAALAELPPGEDTFSWLWKSKKVNPFLVIRSLSNNLLGLISMVWKIKGDCAAFVRDEQGAAAALEEALFNLRHGYVDRALVVSAGSESDGVERAVTGTGNGVQPSTGLCGAVALVLEAVSVQESTGSRTCIDRVVGGIEGDPGAPQDRAHCGDTQEATLNNDCFNGEPQRWGGVLLGIAQALHHQQLSKVPILEVTSGSAPSFRLIRSTGSE